ncbi:hypothetical protein ALI22I_00860 [Saccharothrix sp. ALI-22-I]|nr:hypothetical protein ALI22I_00860 [Saccharothrix sp. ALI-22-I]
MARPSRHPVEVRERVVCLVREHCDEYGSEWAVICSIAGKLGVSGETLRSWVRQAEVDGGRCPGTTTDESAELKRLRRENAELKRANEILKSTTLTYCDNDRL